MFVTLTEPKIAVPVGEATIFSLQGPASQERAVVVENLDGTNTLTYRFQSSNDNDSWVDVDPDDTVPPGGRVRHVLSGSVFYRLRASGLLDVAAKVEAELSFNGAFTTINL